ncbi:MAG: hypothetical protein NTY19_06910 [Planctomycetota bacterium]|nr:hypothetical protein [Planctomycetota bacterium]
MTRDLSEESAASEDAVLQVAKITRAASGNIPLRAAQPLELSGRDIVVGRLEIDDNNVPRLHDPSNKVHTLSWSEVTFRQGSPRSLAEALRNLSWRDVSADRKDSSPQTIDPLDRAWLLARRVNGRISLTAQADTPFPVDHLAEQFPTRDSPNGPVRQSYVVAVNRAGRLILELAPGRYVELPTGLLRQLFSGQLGPGLELGWESLDRGDVMEIERVPAAEDSTAEYLPPFRVVQVHPGNGRQERVSFVTVLQVAADGGLVLGQPGPTAIPADHLRHLLQDRLIDLRSFPAGRLRDETLCKEFDRHGNFLVLEGVITGTRQGANGWLHFVDIGMPVPIQGRADQGYPQFFLLSRPPYPKGTPLRVRVMNIEHRGGRLETCELAVEWDSNRARIRWDGSMAKRFAGSPQVGDSVVVYRGDATLPGDCQVLGYETDFLVEWVPYAGDPFHLHQMPERDFILPRLLPGPESAIWATVEAVEETRRVLRLSRRVQLEQSLPRAGRIGRARLREPLNDRRLLVDVLGTPTVLFVDKLCQGAGRAFRASVEALTRAWVADSAGALSSPELEVVAESDGTVNAVAVYPLPSEVEEVEARIERIVPKGVLANADGCRMFVPNQELACCDLDEELIMQFFRQPNDRLYRVRVPSRSYKGPFSLIRTREVRREVAWLRLAGTEPVYVVLAWDCKEGRAIVRSPSGALMELSYEPGTKVPERGPAYVQSVHETGTVVRLSLERVPVRYWAFPKEREERQEFAIDSVTSQVVRSAILDLQNLDDGPGALAAWASRQIGLEPSPRNLRLVLEEINTRFGHDTAWAAAYGSAGEPADPPCGFAIALGETCNLLTQRQAVEVASPIAQFSLGYWHLLTGNAVQSLPHLHAAIGDAAVGRHVDVWICLARALSLMNAETAVIPPALARRLQLPDATPPMVMATYLLARLSVLVWTGALQTFPLPLFQPSNPNDPERQLWMESLQRGELTSIIEVADRLRANDRERSTLNQARDLWLAIVQGRFDTRLGELTDTLLTAIRDEEEDHREIGAGVYLLAAQLSFARGDIRTGFHHLELAAPPAGEEELSDAMEFWKAWIRCEPLPSTVSPLFAALLDAFRQSRWRSQVDACVVQRLWESLRNTHHRWVVNGPVYRIVPHKPDIPAQVPLWGEEHAIPMTLIDVAGEGSNEE